MEKKLLLPAALFVSCAFFATLFRNRSKSADNAEILHSNVEGATANNSSSDAPSASADCADCSLANSAPQVDRHLLICGNCEDTNWPQKIEKEKDTFACELSSLLSEVASAATTPLKVKMTACNEPNTLPDHYDIIVYPEQSRFSVPTHDRDSLSAFALFISHQTLSSVAPTGVHQSPQPLPWATLLLVCTHGNRDKRCGRAGPIIIEALQAELAVRDIPASKIAVRASSHIGGHKYAGTLIVYPQGQWYGFMTKKNVKPLLDSVLAGGVLDKCFRGLGNVSW
jgi:hypothetical protein